MMWSVFSQYAAHSSPMRTSYGMSVVALTHLPHIGMGKKNWVIIGPGNGLSPVRCQTITWTIAGLLSIELLGTYFSETWIRIYHFHSRLECGTWYHHPWRLQCVLSRNMRIFKVATWHYRCRHNLKINVDIWPAISKSVIHWDHLLAFIT